MLPMNPVLDVEAETILLDTLMVVPGALGAGIWNEHHPHWQVIHSPLHYDTLTL